MRKIILIVLIVLALINCLSFVTVRIALYLRDGFEAKLEREMKGLEVDTMTYLIAGNLNQAQTAFQFLTPELHGDVTYVQFQMMGWNANDAAKQIVRDVKARSLSHVYVYTISLGDHVGRYLEMYLGDSCDLEIIAINPCTDVSFVRQPLRTVLQVGAPIFETLCHGLGWLSAIPFIPTWGDNYSLILLADQYWSIAYDRPIESAEHTIGVICSQPSDDDNDGLLENAAIRDYFRDDTNNTEICIITIKTGHSTMADHGDEYLAGVRQIWQNIKSRS